MSTPDKNLSRGGIKMKKIVSGILLVVLLLSLCGCNSSTYKQAVAHLNNGEYESALLLFEELAANNYKDSAEMIKETKYQFVVNKMDKEDSTVHEYMKELVAADYKDSKKLYDELYAWNFEIAFSASKQSMSHQDVVEATTKLFPFYFINFRITGGAPGEDLQGEYVIKYSTGQESRAGFGDGNGNVLTITCSATQAPIGQTTFTLYDNNGNVLATKSAFIK